MRNILLALLLLAAPAWAQTKFSLQNQTSPAPGGATGDTWYASSATSVSRLGIGAEGYCYTVVSGSEALIPAWAQCVRGTGASGRVAFWSGTSAVTSDSAFYWDNQDKRLGLGTTVPLARLVVSDNATSPPTPPSGTTVHIVGGDAANVRLTLDAFAAGALVNFRRANTSAASPTGLATGEVIGTFNWFGFGSTVYSSARTADVSVLATENWTDSAQGSSMRFRTTPNGGTSITTALFLGNNGYVGVGTASPVTTVSIKGDANGGQAGVQVATELLTVAAAATSVTAGSLLPAGAMVLAVSCRVTTVIPTATSFTLKSTTDNVVFTGAVSVAANSTDPGTTHWAATTSKLSTAAQTITLTITGSNPANNTGRVRITVYYWLVTPPTS